MPFVTLMSGTMVLEAAKALRREVPSVAKAPLTFGEPTPQVPQAHPMDLEALEDLRALRARARARARTRARAFAELIMDLAKANMWTLMN